MCVSSGGTTLFNVWRYVRARRESRLHPEFSDIGALLQEVFGISEWHCHGRQFHLHNSHTLSDRILAATFRTGRNIEKFSLAHGLRYGLRSSF